MADEVTANIVIEMEKNNFDPPTQVESFTTDISGNGMGPTPGAMTVTPAGSSVDLSELDTPGICWIKNLEDDGGSVLEWGLWDDSDGTFEPIGEVWPGERWPFRLSRNLSKEYGTGTDTTGAADSHLRIRSLTGVTCRASVEAYNA